MSRSAVRQALYNYLVTGCEPGSGGVSGVTKVFRAMPWFIDGATWTPKIDLGSGAVIFLHFPDKGEGREADPAASVSTEVVGWKRVDYQVAVCVLYQYLVPSGQQATALAGDEWVAPLDTTLEQLEAWIRADPTAGTGVVGDSSGVIFEMAQASGDLSLPQDLPRWAPGKVFSFQSLHFTATEMIQA